jgi:hypothetical protein
LRRIHHGPTLAITEIVHQEGGDVKTALASHGLVPEGRSTNVEALHDLMHRVESEYREMPGMCVTAAQAQRLWGLDATTCTFVLRQLVERGILRRTPRGTYVRR